MTAQHLLLEEKCALMVIDVQGKLASLVEDAEAVSDRIIGLVKTARILGIPILWVEQYPQGLGPTINRVSDVLEGIACYEKTSFNALATPSIAQACSQLNRQHMLVCGIEAHVCVYQSVVGLLGSGMQVSVVEDCVSSRDKVDKQSGVQRMAAIGADIRSMEMALFELLGDASHPKFKQVLSLIK